MRIAFRRLYELRRLIYTWEPYFVDLLVLLGCLSKDCIWLVFDFGFGGITKSEVWPMVEKLRSIVLFIGEGSSSFAETDGHFKML